MPASPVIIASAHGLNFSGTTLTVGLNANGNAGDVIQIGADTNNGAAVIAATIPAIGLNLVLIGRGFSLSVWAAELPFPVIGPIDIVLVYGGPYNTTSAIAVLTRGPNSQVFFDPNASLPAITTGNPAPPPANFSTTRNDNLNLFWIGCAVGFGGLAPWEDPAITGDNTVGPGAWDWVDGLNNTGLLAPIALALYSQSVSTPQTNINVETSATMQGAAYLVTSLTADPPPPSATSPSQRGLSIFPFAWRKDPIAQGLH